MTFICDVGPGEEAREGGREGGKEGVRMFFIKQCLKSIDVFRG